MKKKLERKLENETLTTRLAEEYNIIPCFVSTS